MVIYFAKKVLILLIAKKMKISVKYSDFSDIFLEEKDFNVIKGNQLELIYY